MTPRRTGQLQRGQKSLSRDPRCVSLRASHTWERISAVLERSRFPPSLRPSANPTRLQQRDVSPFLIVVARAQVSFFYG